MRVDLRDLAVWLEGHNPFSPEEEGRPPNWVASLEAFLAGQITHQAGGARFSVSDLHAVARVSHLLIVLDGFDEIASVGARRKVVDAILKGADRLSELAGSTQVVITSRPAAFANSPGFPKASFPHFSLGPVTTEQAKRYAEHWMAAKGLPDAERPVFIKAFSDRIREPHLRDLARNPMQLAILLNLIRTRGASLPDKRTALYVQYIDVFFSRESEKSAIVKDHRDILISIHGYLAWLLHSGAERAGSRGSITRDELDETLSSYLDALGHDVGLVNILFPGMVERVGVLVERVQGTFEFEVQPLREFFAARHLYETAPYSPAGGEHTGTRPERFDTICRSFYWLNVTRFYGGFCSTGELAFLVNSLDEFCDEEGYRDISYPRWLCVLLLNDWVFFQLPKMVGKVVRLVAKRNGLRLLLACSVPGIVANRGVELPERCGRTALVDECFAELELATHKDHILALCRSVRGNCERDEREARWLERWKDLEEANKPKWLEVGGRLHVFDESSGIMDRIWNDVLGNAKAMRHLLRGNGGWYVEKDEETFIESYDIMMNDPDFWHGTVEVPGESMISTMRRVLDPTIYSDPVQEEELYAESMAKAVELYYDCEVRDMARRYVDVLPHSTRARCLHFLRVVGAESQRPVREWISGPEPWSRVVESAERVRGINWAILCFAIGAVGVIASRAEGNDDGRDLFEESQPLVGRIQQARKERSLERWQRYLSSDDEWQVKMAIAVALAWAPGRVLRELQPVLNNRLEALSADSWRGVSKALHLAISARRSPAGGLRAAWLDSDAGARLTAAYANRCGRAEAQQIYEARLMGYDGSDSDVWEFCQAAALWRTRQSPEHWDHALRVIRSGYSQGAMAFTRRSLAPGRDASIPSEIGRRICAAPHQYPLSLLRVAEARLAAEVGRRVRPVGETARERSWFED